MRRGRLHGSWHLRWLCAGMLVCAVEVLAQPVLMVTDLQGEVTDGGGSGVALLAELEAGSRVVVAAGGKFTAVHLMNGAEYVIAGPADLHIEVEGITRDGAPVGGQVLMASVAAQATSGYAQAAVVMRAPEAVGDDLRMRYPVQSRIVETSPSFLWDSLGEGFEYRFELLDQRGVSLYVTETESTGITWPEGPALPRGELLTWELEATRGAQTEFASAEFVVAAQAEVEELHTADPGSSGSRARRIAYARLLEQLGFRHAAESAWEALGIARGSISAGANN